MWCRREGVVVILLLRHGRTEANAGGLLLGRADPELDDEGRRQAVALAAAVRAAVSASSVERVVSSPLVRCQQTAAAVASGLRVPVTVDERWIELDYGELDGMPTALVARETWAAWSADLSWAPEGGESLAALGERVRSACDELAREADGDGVGFGGGAAGGAATGPAFGDVVVVTHVSPIKAAVAWALGVGDEVAWRLFVAPGSMTRIAVSGARRSLHSFNEIAHLG
jgi:broad specificity phosphatase PhoE